MSGMGLPIEQSLFSFLFFFLGAGYVVVFRAKAGDG